MWQAASDENVKIPGRKGPLPDSLDWLVTLAWKEKEGNEALCIKLA